MPDLATRFRRDSTSDSKIFADRRDAGRQLALQLSDLFDREQLQNVVLVALPRGGVPVAHQVSILLGVPVDVLFVRKLGAPMQPEYAIGAMCEDSTAFVDEEAARSVGVDEHVLAEIMDRESARIAEYRQRFGADVRTLDVRGRDVIVIDDGLATGRTALAAARYLRKHEARTITFAAPVCAAQSLEQMKGEFDRAVCIEQPSNLRAIGLWYDDFRATPDEEIASILADRA